MANIIKGTSGADNKQGTDDEDVLYGGAGDDVLSTGGEGAWLSTTKLYGGAGNDYCSISRVSDPTLVDDAVPQVIEYANQGIDTIGLGSSFVNEMTSYQMPDNVEHLVAIRHPAAALGSTPDEYMSIKSNGLGSDHIGDGAGNDTLIKVGSDIATLLGGSGNDSYYLGDRGYYGSDIGFMAGWSVGEKAGEGHDTVYTKTASSFLPDHVEDLVYMGADQATTLHGNAGDNFIRGGHWNADTLYGYGGDDVLDGGLYDHADTLYGGNGDDTLVGGDGADTLNGWYGNDTLLSGWGADVLTGGGGADKFRFNAVLDSTTISGVDKLMDFQQGLDKIDLSTIDANVWAAGNQAFNFIGQQPFQPGFLPGQMIQKFVGGNTVLQADYDGNATVDFELVVVGLVTFTTADFVL
ncbi:MAG: M10 family metallopeptidase C-terminal domain-containing protein [Burkholderiales bacterium]|nr:M10 family metallopeptidase C-terminal domain-containing protein [Burkholderiales bacterium]